MHIYIGLRGSLVALALALLTTACVPTFTDPPPADSRPDPALLGTWQSPASESDRSQVLFLPRLDGGLDIVHLTDMDGSSEKGVGVAIYTGYTTTVGTEQFLCFRAREAEAKPGADNRAHLMARYRYPTPAQLEVQLFATDAVRGLIEDGRLQGTIEKQERLPDSVLVTSPAQVVTEAIASAGADVFVSGSSVMRFERMTTGEAAAAVAP